MDAHKNESQCYRPHNHNLKFKSEKWFNIDGTLDGSLKTFVQNSGLHNILNTKHGDENAQPIRIPGSSVIDCVYVSEGLLSHVVGIRMLHYDAEFDSDRRTFFLDIDIDPFFGSELNNMPAPQSKQLQLDNPRIAEGYRKILPKLLTTHNIYRRVQIIVAKGKKEDWTMKRIMMTSIGT
jgi:hypothetical protein